MKARELDLSKASGSISFSCIRVNQPIGAFYIASIPYKDVIDVTYADVRRIHGERGFETYLGIQRPLNDKKTKKLAEYTNFADSSFPTAVILSIPAACASFDESSGQMTLEPYASEDGNDSIAYGEIAKVLDGQHRIDGLKGCTQEEFDITVSIFVDIDVDTEAQLFSTVNLMQTKVNKSLVYDLFDLSKTRSPQKLCHTIAVELDSNERSPLYKRIKRLGVATKENHPSSITQAAFVQSLLKHISREELKDRDRYMRGKKPVFEEKDSKRLIFRKFLINERDFELTDILWNYFSAISGRWPIAWNTEDAGFMLAKTNGFMALMRFLKDIYVNEDRIGDVLPEGFFTHIFSQIDLDDSEFTIDNYKPGSSGEGALYRKLKECVGYK